MPELPEVETVVRTLETKILNKRIEYIRILYPRIIENDIEMFKSSLIHESFRVFKRRGKYLLFEMDHCTLVVHLRMEGKFYILDKDVPYDKHTHIVFGLDDGSELRYHDVRKFGRMEIIEHSDYKNFKCLGPEPFDEAFNKEYVYQYLKGHKLPMKQLLLRQDFVAGIGNIYADEILFATHLNPKKSSEKVSLKKAEEIVTETGRILKQAIEKGGTTIRSYTSSLGVTGRFQLSLKVHGLKECPDCHTPIKKIRVGGRGTYYCPLCQK